MKQKYNKSEIMKTAWEMFNDEGCDLFGRKTTTFSTCLKIAWGNAKLKANRPPETIQTLEKSIFMIHMKDRLDSNDWEEIRQFEMKKSKLVNAQQKKAS